MAQKVLTQVFASDSGCSLQLLKFPDWREAHDCSMTVLVVPPLLCPPKLAFEKQLPCRPHVVGSSSHPLHPKCTLLTVCFFCSSIVSKKSFYFIKLECGVMETGLSNDFESHMERQRDGVEIA